MERRTPLARGAALQRRTALAAGKPLARGTGLARTAPMPRPRPPTDAVPPLAGLPAPRRRNPMPRRPDVVTAEERAAKTVVRARSGLVCELCRRAPYGSWAHRVAEGQGGLWVPANGLGLCGTGAMGVGCHGWCHDNPTAAKAGRWILESWQDPYTEPAWLPGRGWVLLDDIGGWAPADVDWLAPVQFPWITRRTPS